MPARRTETERLYSIEELAQLWGVNRSTVERLMQRGELRYVRIGARRRIPASSADAYLEANRDLG